MMMMIRACSISQPILNGNFFNVEIIEDSLHAMCRYCLFLLVYITIIRKQRSFFSGFLFQNYCKCKLHPAPIALNYCSLFMSQVLKVTCSNCKIFEEKKRSSNCADVKEIGTDTERGRGGNNERKTLNSLTK